MAILVIILTFKKLLPLEMVCKNTIIFIYSITLSAIFNNCTGIVTSGAAGQETPSVTFTRRQKTKEPLPGYLTVIEKPTVLLLCPVHLQNIFIPG
jgi:hypothetical protein